MAHVADLMLKPIELSRSNTPITREPTASPPPNTLTTEAPEKHIWRMQPALESRKYQLFPSSMTSKSRKISESDSDLTSTHITNTPSENERSGAMSKLKAKEPSLVRRRKISVPELGPMTTVQEVSMDSPTIPGRPPVHERSISAPGYNWKSNAFGESMLYLIPEPTLDEAVESTFDDQQQKQDQPHRLRSMSSSSEAILSPRSLTPLIIPSVTSAPPQRVLQQTSATKVRSSSNPPIVPPKSGRWHENSPHGRSSPFTPLSAAPTTAPTTVTNTPVSATAEGRSSPKPWISLSGRSSPISKPWVVSLSGRMSPKQIMISATGRSSPRLHRVSSGKTSPKPVVNTAPSTSSAAVTDTFGPFINHRRYDSDTTQKITNHHGHRRHESDNSIMDRGRPKKRSESAHIPRPAPIQRKPSKRAQHSPAHSAELIKAFETLPSGHLASHAQSLLSGPEVEALRVQAIGQASRFEVLQSRDVDSLSRELRGLDERCEYLRKTHRSLRGGRRNLHERICTYLRSPRTAKFSHESLLKQEEALSELDASIDDWVSKLEQAENRRTRVRQKLLEHVAGALIMMPSPSVGQKFQMGAQGESTPPRSPTIAPVMTTSPSPESSEGHCRIPDMALHHQSAVPDHTIQQLQQILDAPIPEHEKGRRSVESIHIYADSGVYALMADVEEEMNRMGECQ